MLNATLVKKIELTKDLIFFCIKPDFGVSDFSPGQYVALGLPDPTAVSLASSTEKVKLIKRAYSIGSSPENKDYLEFYIAIVENGQFTPLLAALKEGDRLNVANKITGTFLLKNAPEEANYVFVSTGTGIAPFMAMIRTPSTWKSPSGKDRKVTLVHGVRYVSDLAYRDEIMKFVNDGYNIEYHSVVSRPDGTWTGEKGYVQRFFDEEIVKLDSNLDHVFLCGNPAMIEGLQKILEVKGYKEHSRKSPGNLHLEKYW